MGTRCTVTEVKWCRCILRISSLSLSLLAISWVAKGIARCFRSCCGDPEKGTEEGITGDQNDSMVGSRCRLRSDRGKGDKMYREVEDYEWGG